MGVVDYKLQTCGSRWGVCPQVANLRERGGVFAHQLCNLDNDLLQGLFVVFCSGFAGTIVSLSSNEICLYLCDVI